MEYENSLIAEIYDLINPPAEDAAFYLSLAGPRPSSILDLGCGTGKLCCTLAKLGHDVTGIDPATAMLNIAKTQPCAERVGWVESSAQNYDSHRRFDLIVMTGHVFQILLTDTEALAVLEKMRGHLKPRGRVAFESRNPYVDWAGEWAGRQRVFRTAAGEQILEVLEVTGHDAEFISFRTAYHFRDLTLATSSTLWFPSRERMESMIARSGLVVHNVFGDWDAGPFVAARSREIIFVAGIAE
jgi:SAM-dependent methyltransferase